jgi:NADPH:quinone reductase-like Zn-dependent oxidoreductase
MKAIVQDRYGEACDVLHPERIDQPKPGEGEVLLRVHAVGVERGVWHTMTGLPYPFRLVTGIRGPRTRVRGREVAGRVAAVGAGVADLRPGEEVVGVVGISEGAFAEYAVAKTNKLVPKPANVSFEQAAAVPISGPTALQAVRDAGKVQPGQRVLIIGASGGVGTFAVQIAKAVGAHVTGVCSTDNVDMVCSLGADDVIDYTTRDYTQTETTYDVIVDMVGDRPLNELRQALTPTGTLVMVAGSGGRWFNGTERLLLGLVSSRFSRQSLRPLIHEQRPEDLAVLRALVEEKSVVPFVTATYPLEKVSLAIGHYCAGHARGKVAITV